MNLCTCDSQECESGVCVDVNTVILFETLQVVGLTEVSRTSIRFRKQSMNLCVCDIEDRERWFFGKRIVKDLLFFINR
jgi:hypothetical protein